MNVLPNEPLNSRLSFRIKVGGWVGAILLVGLGHSANANSGYEVTGHLTYTAYAGAGEPRTKNVLMFQVQAANGRWRIRTEPVERGPRDIGYFEASGGTNDSVFALTAFQTPGQEAKSPFTGLRAHLKETHSEAVFFTNPPPPQMPEDYARLMSPSDPSGLNARPFSSHANNVAVASVVKGAFPQVTSSHVALLWFAFVASKANEPDSKHLFQIWDDGNRNAIRFRNARWGRFSESPFLVERAEYCWTGYQIFEDGRQENIRTSDVSNPVAIAARYEVIATTNLAGWRFPQHFTLTRYSTIQTGAESPHIVTTIVATTVAARRFSPPEPLQVTVPGKTYVTDYRGPGRPENYFLDSDGSKSNRP